MSVFKEGTSAFQAFTENPERFDLIITDYTMPLMTSKELSAKVLNIRNELPIILCTGYHETFTQEMADRIEISRFIQKPLTGPVLSSLIREILDEKTMAPEND